MLAVNTACKVAGDRVSVFMLAWTLRTYQCYEMLTTEMRHYYGLCNSSNVIGYFSMGYVIALT